MSVAAVREDLLHAARRCGLELGDEAVAKLATYVATLLLWRTRMSLTAASTAAEIVQQHVADSFAVLPHLPNGCCVADLGSGAGFPGVVLAITRPDAQVALIEARRKRASFLREVLRQAAITNAQVIEARVEALPQELIGTFDVVTSRAFGPVSEFLALSRPLLRPGGVAIAMKGPKGRDESKAQTGFDGPEIATYALEPHGQRLLLKYTRA